MRRAWVAFALVLFAALVLLRWVGALGGESQDTYLAEVVNGATARQGVETVSLDPEASTRGTFQFTPTPSGEPNPATLRVEVEWDDSTIASSVEILLRQLHTGLAIRSPAMRVTDAGGLAMFESLTAGEYEVTAPLGAQANVTLAHREEKLLRLSIPRGHSVLLHVVDGDGLALPAAEIWLSHGFNVASGWILGQTDSAGSFAHASVPDGRYLGIRKAGYVAGDLFVTGQDTSPGAEVTIVLERGGGALSGTVRRASSGEVVPDALVCIGSPSGFPHSGRAQSIYRVGPPPFLVRSDIHGRFRVSGVPCGTLPVVVLADGCAAESAQVGLNDGDEARLDLWVEDACGLFGIVVDAAGASIPGALIGAGDRETFEYVATRSDEQGRYVLNSLGCGQITLWASHSMHGTTARQVDVNGAGEVRLVLAGGGVVRGRVVDRSGLIQVGSRVEILALSPAGEPDGVLGTWETDEGGEFTARTTRCSSGMRVCVRSRAAPASIPVLETQYDAWPSTPILLVVPAAADCGGTLRGQIVDAQGLDRGGTVVILATDSGRNATTLSAPKSGTFEFSGLCAGTYTTRVHSGEFSVVVSEVYVGVGATLDLGPLRVGDIGRLRLHPDSLGPPGGTQVRVVGSDRHSTVEHQVAETPVEVDLRAGTYEVEWLRGGSDLQRRTIQVLVGRHVDVRLSTEDL